MNDIERAIGTILVVELGVEGPADRLSPEDGLHGDLGLDSLGVVELRNACEKEFDITIAEADATPEHFATIGSVADVVRRLGGRPTAAGT